MRSLIRLKDYTKDDVFNIFKLADELKLGRYKGFLEDKTIVMFLPDSSIRTRVTFEKGIKLLGGQSILFSPSSLDRKERIEDIIGYLNNWADALVVRYKDISVIDRINKYSNIPVINAMSDVNHPCEIISDMYSLSKIRDNFIKDKYLFVGENGNIGLAWKEASELMGFSLVQASPEKYRIDGIKHMTELKKAIIDKDIVCTDSLNHSALGDFFKYRITFDVMKSANDNAVLNPCPPFYIGEEVSEKVINSKYFVGYEFKKNLLEIQQAIIIYSMI